MTLEHEACAETREREFVSTSTSGHDFAYNKYYALHYKFPDPQCNACGATRYVHAIKHILLPRQHIVNVIYSRRAVYINSLFEVIRQQRHF